MTASKRPAKARRRAICAVIDDIGLCSARLEFTDTTIRANRRTRPSARGFIFREAVRQRPTLFVATTAKGKMVCRRNAKAARLIAGKSGRVVAYVKAEGASK
jgi:hypothetical protein